CLACDAYSSRRPQREPSPTYACNASWPWPVTRMTRPGFRGAKLLRRWSMRGRPATKSIDFGRSCVNGRRRLPWPAARITTSVIAVGHMAELVAAHAKAWRGAMEVIIARQATPRGTGHAVAAAAKHVRGDALVVMGDGHVAASTLRALAQAEGFMVAAHRLDD